MAPRRLLVAMVASAVMAVTAGAVSAQGRPPTEAETILQQTLRDIDAKARGVKPTTNRQLAQRLPAPADLPPPIAGLLQASGPRRARYRMESTRSLVPSWATPSCG